MFAGFSPEGSVKRGALEPELDGLLVHPLDERGGAAVRDAREDAGGGVVRRDQREVQDLVQRDPVVRAEIGGRGRVDVAALDGDLLREVGAVLEEHQRRHHLGDAGDRALVLGVLFPEHLARLGVENDGGGGADIGDQGAGRVGLEPRTHRFLERLEAGLFTSSGGGAGTGEPGLAGLRGAGRIRRLRATVRVVFFFVAPSAATTECKTPNASSSASSRATFRGRIKRTNPPIRQRLAGIQPLQ